MLKRKNRQFGFTLLEVLVASFIFASVLAVVYSLLNDALISKKDLELTLTVNEQVKNANEVLQTVMREASGDFFTDGEFKTDPANPPTDLAHLFFISSQSGVVDPSSHIVAPDDYNRTVTGGKNLYVKVLEDNIPKIYVFSFQTGSLNLQSWKEDLITKKWGPDQRPTLLLSYNPSDSSAPYQFVVPKKVDPNTRAISPRSIYQPNQGILTPMDLYVQMKVTAISNWKATTYEREMNQTYVPLITSNPYL